MKTTKELRDFWAQHKEREDVTKIAKAAKISHSVISRILSGEKENVPVDIVRAINKFYRVRAEAVKKETEINID